MNKKCPCCGNETLYENSDYNHRYALVSYEHKTEKSGVHLDKIVPCDVYICKTCNFISLFSATDLLNKTTTK